MAQSDILRRFNVIICGNEIMIECIFSRGIQMTTFRNYGFAGNFILFLKFYKSLLIFRIAQTTDKVMKNTTCATFLEEIPAIYYRYKYFQAN